MVRINDYTVSQFGGLNTAIKDIQTLKKGVSPDSLNWLTGTFSDNIQLRRGQALLGTIRQTGTGKVTGLGIGLTYAGVQVPFFSHGRKLKYYNVTTDDTAEIGTDTLPVGADGEDVWFAPYQNLGGSFIYCGSSNSSIYKIPTANPASIVDQSVSSYRFGLLKIGQGRSFAGQRNGTTAGNNDKTGLYLSYVDKALLSSYTQVTSEAVGALGSTTYTGTLTARTGVRTVMYVQINEATGETLIDDRNGNLVGNQGSTGTINYATGAYSVTFNHTTAGAVTADYYWEDSTSAGILDFTGSTFGQGANYRQDDGGGNLQAIYPINNVEYCFHLLKTWQLTTATSSSETSTNLPYRSIGISYPRASYPTPEGIMFADLSRQNEPKFRSLQIAPNTTNLTVEPIAVSDALDLSPYGFSHCVVFRWGDYELFAFAEKNAGTENTFNSKMFLRNVFSGAWDFVDFYSSCLAEYLGTLISGDSISNNVFTLFSGYDDDGDVISNYWTSGDDKLGTDRLKTCRRLVLEGLIQKEQSFKVSISYDGGTFTEVKTVLGSGDYVDSGINTFIGAPTIGSSVIGGGGADTAHPFRIDFPLNSDKFQTIRIKFEALGIGYLQINEYTFKDIRDKGEKSMKINTI